MARAPQYQSPYQKLSEEEIQTILRQRKIQTKREEVKKIIHGLYGPTAVAVVVLVESYYNDEFDEETIEAVRVFDKENKLLPIDLEAPLSKKLLKDGVRNLDEQSVAWKLDFLYHRLLSKSYDPKLPVESATYLLDDAPICDVELYVKKSEYGSFLIQQTKREALFKHVKEEIQSQDDDDDDEEEEDSDLEEYDGEREGYVYNDECYVREEDINSDEPPDDEEDEEDDDEEKEND